MRQSSFLLVTAVAALLSGCPKDQVGPTAPVLDPTASITSLPSITLSGTAEFLSSVEVVTAPGSATFTTEADGTTGAFSVDVDLTVDAENTLTVTAIDSEGNRGEPVDVVVTHESPRAETLSLAIEQTVVDSDTGILSVAVTAQNDEGAVDLTNLVVDVTVADYPLNITAAQIGPDGEFAFDSDGRARVALNGLTQVGTGVVVVTAAVPGAAGEIASARSGFVVLSGAPTAVDVALTATVDGASVGPGADITVPSSTNVDVNVTITDTAGNVVPNAPVKLEIQGGTASVVGQQIRDLLLVGSYRVVAAVGEGLVAGEATINVTPTTPDHIDLTVDSAALVAGDTLAATARVVDAAGNLVTDATVTLAIDAPVKDLLDADQTLAVTAVSGGADGTLQLRTSGDFTLTASSGSLPDATATIAVQAGAPTGATINLSEDPLPAGNELVVTPAFVDAFLNPTSTGFSVATDAPGALVVGDRVLSITQANDGGTPYRLLVHTDAGLVISRDLVVAPAALHSLSLTLSSNVATAGDTVTATAQVVDVYGNIVHSAAPGLTTDSPQDFAPAPSTADGVTTATVEVTLAGSYTVTATSEGLNDATASLDIAAGAPVNANITLSQDPLVAGTPLTVTPNFTDAFGNASPTGFSLVTDAPGALVAADRILSMTTANEGGAAYQLLVQTAAGTVFSRDLFVTAAAADHVDLTLSSIDTAAGTTISATAKTVDAFGNTLRTNTPALSTDSPQDFSPVPTTTDGVTIGTLQVTTAGSYTLTATDGVLAAATASLKVNPDAPVNLTFNLTNGNVAAGDAVPFTYSLVDAFNNQNFSVPVQVTVNAPNTAISNDGLGNGEINGITRAGSYVVRARAIGTGLADNTENLVVGPNPQNAGFNLQLSTGLIAESGSLLTFVTDGFGNPIAAADVTFVGLDASIGVNANQLTFSLPGTYSIQACLTATPTLCDTEFVSVQGLLDTVPPTAVVTIRFPDTAVTNTVPINGSIVFDVAVTDNRGLSSVSYVATFGNSAGCTRTGGPVLLNGGTTSKTLNFSFSMPGCAVPSDDIVIVAKAVDEAGNSRNSGPHAPLFISSPFNFTTNGFIVSVAAFQDRLKQPTDVVSSNQIGQLVDANNGDNRAISISLDRFMAKLVDQQGNRLDIRRTWSVAADAAGKLFFTVQQTQAGGGGPSGGVVRYNPDATVDYQFIDSSTVAGIVASDPRGMAIDETTGMAQALCYADNANNSVDCFTNLDAAGSPTLLFSQATGGGTQPMSVGFEAVSVAVPFGGLYVALDGVFAAGNGGQQVAEYTFNDATRTTVTFVRNINLSATFAANTMGDIEVAPNTGNLLMTNRGTGNLVQVDVTNNTAVDLVTGFTDPVGLAFDGANLLVVDRTDEVIFRVSPDPAAPGVF